ncbi:hypothetical protein HNQ80_002608 [Anaerosolibacter carboniphilus]|uniref:DUF2802 domain-containing protein n=1 Tax=Anaerosolibacter carboniphilus TaxID=1417629 RepID=A0A841KSF4_9FIRM|nr:hypothetical protein [Anaerosolibacter carboniphilus]MBB6216506.1 hypothetical protein [Anaerosolibacter carboniphilus]
MTTNIIYYLVFFIGAGLVLLSYFVLRRQQSTFFSPEDHKLREQEKKLAEYIELAEEIIEELNTVSEQIIQSIDARTVEMCHMMDDIDKRLKSCKEVMDKYPSEMSKDSHVIMDDFADEKELLRIPSVKAKAEDANHLATNEILRLFDEGNSPSQIAKLLNKGIGEVQLILNLRKK